jgi:tryptophanyl-tRNA synthetase
MPRYNPKKALAKAAGKPTFKKDKQRESTGLTKQFTKGTSSKTSVDFVKTKRKVGKKIKKSNNTNEDAKVTSKRVNVLEQSVAANLSNDGTLRTKRGTGMQELVNRTTHHAGKTRKEALEGMLELLSEFKQEARCAKRCARGS